jgi:hypothetical protein
MDQLGPPVDAAVAGPRSGRVSAASVASDAVSRGPFGSTHDAGELSDAEVAAWLREEADARAPRPSHARVSFVAEEQLPRRSGVVGSENSAPPQRGSGSRRVSVVDTQQQQQQQQAATRRVSVPGTARVSQAPHGPAGPSSLETALAREAAAALLRHLKGGPTQQLQQSEAATAAVTMTALLTALQASEARCGVLSAELAALRVEHATSLASASKEHLRNSEPDAISMALLNRLSVTEATLRVKDAALEAARSAAAAHSADLAQMETHALSVRDELQRLRHQVREAQNAGEQATGDALRWRSQAEAAQAEAAHLRKAQGHMEREQDRLHAELLSARSHAEMQLSVATSAEERMNAMRADVRYARERAALSAQTAEQKALTWKDDAQRAQEAHRQLQKQREALRGQLTEAHRQLQAFSGQLTDAHRQLQHAANALRQAAATEKQLKEWGDTWRLAAEEAQRKLSRCAGELDASRVAAQNAAKEADDRLTAAAALSANVAAPAAVRAQSEAAAAVSLPPQAGIVPPALRGRVIKALGWSSHSAHARPGHEAPSPATGAHLRFARPSQNDDQAVSALVAAASAGTPAKAADDHPAAPSPPPLARSSSGSPEGARARVAAAVAALEKGQGPADAAASTPPSVPSSLPAAVSRSSTDASPPLVQLVSDAAQSVAHQQHELHDIEILAQRMEATRDAAIQQLSSRLAAVQLQKRNSQSGEQQRPDKVEKRE